MTTAFALSGGGARGAMQVGMMRALLEKQVRPDFIVGVSAGAWNGTWLAHQPDLECMDGLERAWLGIDQAIMSLPWWRAVWKMMRRSVALYDSTHLAGLASRHLGELKLQTFEDLAIPLHVIALDLSLGKKAVFSQGPLAPAMLASAAIPGVFPPVLIEGHQYVDGGFADTTGVQTASELGATTVYALDVVPFTPVLSPLRSMEQVMGHSVELESALDGARTIQEVGSRTNLIHLRPIPEQPWDALDFSHAREYLELGYRHARDSFTELGERSLHVLTA